VCRGIVFEEVPCHNCGALKKENEISAMQKILTNAQRQDTKATILDHFFQLLQNDTSISHLGVDKNFTLHTLIVDYDNYLNANKGLLHLNTFSREDILSQYYAKHDDITVSPNPFGNFINIKGRYNTNENVQVFIYDVLGNLVFNQSFQTPNISIDTAHLPNGSYQLITHTSSKPFVFHLIKLSTRARYHLSLSVILIA
jgi:hypothetical protein